jgi:flavorubredoxin
VICITTKENWEHIKHYEINPKSVKQVEPYQNPDVKLSSGHQIKLIPVPYCASPNSIMSYDTENGVLFSGSLFSSEYYEKGESSNSLFAEKSDWPAMESFHLKNMSSKSAMINALHLIKTLNPLPEIIAPRNGKLIQLVNLDFFIRKLRDLEVGFENLTEIKEKKAAAV